MQEPHFKSDPLGAGGLETGLQISRVLLCLPDYARWFPRTRRLNEIDVFNEFGGGQTSLHTVRVQCTQPTYLTIYSSMSSTRLC